VGRESVQSSLILPNSPETNFSGTRGMRPAADRRSAVPGNGGATSGRGKVRGRLMAISHLNLAIAELPPTDRGFSADLRFVCDELRRRLFESNKSQVQGGQR